MDACINYIDETKKTTNEKIRKFNSLWDSLKVDPKNSLIDLTICVSVNLFFSYLPIQS
ncbi:hypothetical protein SAMN06265350_107107 [Solitalea koreensis]|uniref:Uncharacterized protein n=1 Tax=Solitalea koreensis TaxID=543615 RepID=A0A521DKV1_9SPHI|nr:hypothetical protein SAMN06265350_107107 [Solitalea koreensis]